VATSERNLGRRIWIGRADPDADYGQPDGRHSSSSFRPHPFWRHVQHFGVWRAKGHSVLCSWRNLRGDALRRPFVDPDHLRETPLTVLVGREDRIAISHAGGGDPLVFEADITRSSPNRRTRSLFCPQVRVQTDYAEKVHPTLLAELSSVRKADYTDVEPTLNEGQRYPPRIPLCQSEMTDRKSN